jgi:hypothetical protein
MAFVWRRLRKSTKIPVGIAECKYLIEFGSQGIFIGIVTRLQVGRPRNHGSITGRDKRYFSFFDRVQTGSGPHPASCPILTRSYFYDSKAVRA